ncbi:MAG: DMT family transporter [Candidatus Sericytochromatia bacterium]|nr:DMT family transporter [Candidatus Sericytochromatia bacterium]
MKIYAIVLALLSAALFGAATPASKTLLQSFSPFQLAGLLYLGGIFGVLPLLIKEYSKGELTNITTIGKKNLLRLSGSILFGGVLGPVFLLFGLNIASASSVSIWLNLEMVATAILGYFLFKDQLEANQWLSIIGVTISGILLSFGEGQSGILAGLFITLACFSWGADNHLAALVDGISPSQSTFWKSIIAGTVNLTIGLLIQPFLFSIKNIILALIVGAFSYGLSITLHIAASQQIGATRVQMIFSSSPFFGIAISSLFLKESLSYMQIISALILSISLFILFRAKHEHQHHHESMEHNHTHRHDDKHHNHTHIGLPTSTRHSHEHYHETMDHLHSHLPDIHHRHSH